MKIKEILREMCPDGVEYKKLEDVCEFITGFAFKANLFRKEGNPICKTTNISDGYICFENMECFCLSDYKEDLSRYIVKPNDVVIGMSGTIKVGINNSQEACYLNQRVGKFIPDTDCINNKFLYYFLMNSIGFFYEVVSGGSVKNLSNNDIKSLMVPVPPLSIQEEIVRILDKFTELEAELEKELKARRKQYEYYREKLFDFSL